MSTLRQEFVKAALETPRMFFAPLKGAYDAVVREFRSESKEKKKKKKEEALVASAATYRRVRIAARRAKHQKLIASDSAGEK